VAGPVSAITDWIGRRYACRLGGWSQPHL